MRAETDATARELPRGHHRVIGSDWVRSLSIPFDWQEAVIRAAITLKLCNYEETGAIVAALTTSIPEAPGTQRNWDYRYLLAARRLFRRPGAQPAGHDPDDGGLSRLTSRISSTTCEALGRSEDLPPLFGITRQADLEERFAPALQGYRGMGPVRVGNAAYTQVQNDVYGAIVLAATHIFFDKRLIRPGQPAAVRASGAPREARAASLRPARCGAVGAAHQGLRTHLLQRDVLGRLRPAGPRSQRCLAATTAAHFWAAEAIAQREVIEARAYNLSSALSSPRSTATDLDATLLLLQELDFVEPNDPRFIATVDAVGAKLEAGRLAAPHTMSRTISATCTTAFMICGFWYVDALAAIGRRDEARELFERILA